MAKFLKKILGSKAERDYKAVSPVMKTIQAVSESISVLSNDELRAKTLEFKERINAYIEDEETQIKELKDKIEKKQDIGIEEKENIM